MLLENENGLLNVKINGLGEEASDAAENLQDAITTNDALTKKLKELEHERQTCKCVYKFKCYCLYKYQESPYNIVNS